MTPPHPLLLTNRRTDPLYLFIYLLNYSLIPSLVWPFNDLPGGAGRGGAFTSGTDDRWFIGKIKADAVTFWAFTVCVKKVMTASLRG